MDLIDGCPSDEDYHLFKQENLFHEALPLMKVSL